MCFFDADTVRRKMNIAGEEGRPFLFAVDFELTEGVFVPDPVAGREVFFEVCGKGNRRAFVSEYGTGTSVEAGSAAPVPEPIGFGRYEEMFAVVRRGLLRGDSFLTNLTVRTPITTSLSLADIFVRASAPYLLYVPGRFVCFSPERFVCIDDGRISTNPMKGTIRADVPDAERVILADFKETAEHNTIVDLLRNDLSINASGVHVERFRYVDRIALRGGDILQVSSEIVGRLGDGYLARLGNIIFDMLPAGSVSGAPKSSTVRIIREAEGIPRGYYTGVFGYFDGRRLDSGVLIRFVEQSGVEMFFRSGGGITAYSDCRSEYDEVMEKIYFPFV